MRSRTMLAAIAVLLAGACSSRPVILTSSGPPAPLPTPSMVDIGGYSLAIACQGSGSPTIVTEAGYDSAGLDTWVALMSGFAKSSRVCAYDRAGTGMSDPRTRTHGVTSATQAEELHMLLQRAGIEGPYVLVAHSYGGFVARLFAAAYRQEVTGMVLIESSQEEDVPAYDRYYHGGPEADWIDGGTKLDIPSTADLLHTTARDYGDIPLLVIQAHRYDDVLSEALWRRTQADLATLSADGMLIRSGRGGHFVQDDNPDLVLAAVAAVVRSARDGTPLQACTDLTSGLDATCP